LTAGGHIHRTSPSCHTLTPGATLVALLPELTGLTEAEVIAKVGFQACTHCFPFAPAVPAWIAGQKEAAAADEAKKAGRCQGTGKSVSAGRRRYAQCPDCKRSIGVTGYGILRPHKPTGD
ncbi:MAG TPA: hypothetical protein VH208_11655, partial [Myxococcaceae bacterium]|nr:hypothetical protein [Myxococcaceae bacterium]